MINKASILTIACIFITAGYVSADDNIALGQGDKNGKRMPPACESFRNAVETLVNDRNEFEAQPDAVNATNYIVNNSADISSINYDSSGRIRSVIYKNDVTVRYTYQLDTSGGVRSISLNADNGVIVTLRNSEKGFTAEIKKSDSVQNKDVAGKEDYEPIIVIISSEERDLERAARDPIDFDFKGIARALDHAAAARKLAHDEYVKNTQPYYEKIAIELKYSRESLKKQGVDVDKYLDVYTGRGSTIAQRREAIDKAVAFVKTQAPEKSSTREFIINEKECRVRVLEPNQEIYEGKIEKALDYINSVIDMFMNSRIAVYMNRKVDKIEAVIKLPQKTEK